MNENLENEHVELAYILDKNGWSTCLLYVDQCMYALSPTHIFGHPLETLFKSLTVLLIGTPSVEFLWHDEPGEYKWSIVRDQKQKHRVNVTVTGVAKLNWEGRPEPFTLSFNVKLRQFCISVQKEGEKIMEMMQDKSFRTSRSFPYAEFEEFTRAFRRAYIHREMYES